MKADGIRFANAGNYEMESRAPNGFRGVDISSSCIWNAERLLHLAGCSAFNESKTLTGIFGIL
jgi:hypothetical protein